ncbi:MAG: TatD family hydrolase [Lachnospiraceae bacterium]|nr:TatD family hydrolase [Lachnospiraceae bacterium]
MKIFDTHAHYSDAQYDTDREQVFEKMFSFGVDRVTVIGASFNESLNEKNIALKYTNNKNMPEFYYTVGDHPDEIPKFDPESVDGVKYLDTIEKIANDSFKKAIAIGEIGLDYHGDFKTEEDYANQKKWFLAEIELARKLKLPIVIHSRDACKDTFDIVKQYASDLKGIVHCFSYEKEIALEYVKLGYYIGIGGTVTFKNARKTKEVVESVPLDSIVTETDAPYLAPTPHRGERNDSTYIDLVIDEICNLKKLEKENASEVLYNNALNVYNLN